MLPEITNIDDNLQNELMRYFKGNKDGYVQVGPEKWFYPIKYKEYAEEFKNFEVRSDDLWIMGIPRSGTTMTQDLVYYMNCDTDLSTVNERSRERVVFFEHAMVVSDSAVQERKKTHPEIEPFIERRKTQLQELKNFEGQRIFKTHLPFSLLPSGLLDSGCKVIYLCRYPKDCAVSYFHLQKSLWAINYVGDFGKYWEFFKNGHCMFGPYFEHVRQGYEKKNCKNVLFLFYEDMKKDFRKYIENLSQFFEKPLSEIEIEKLLNHFQIDNYKKAMIENTNLKYTGKPVQYVRQGTAGGWKDSFTEDMNEEADNWIENNCRRIGLEYPKLE